MRSVRVLGYATRASLRPRRGGERPSWEEGHRCRTTVALFLQSIYYLKSQGGEGWLVPQKVLKKEKAPTSPGVFLPSFCYLSSPFLVFWAVLGWTRPPIVEVE